MVKIEYFDKFLDINLGVLNVVRLDVGLVKYCRGFILDFIKCFYLKVEWCISFIL